jgi:hypothetical protein
MRTLILTTALFIGLAVQPAEAQTPAVKAIAGQCYFMGPLRASSDTGPILQLDTKRTRDSHGNPAFRITVAGKRFVFIPHGTWRAIAPDSIAIQLVFEDTGVTYRLLVASRNTLRGDGDYGDGYRTAVILIRAPHCK